MVARSPFLRVGASATLKCQRDRPQGAGDALRRCHAITVAKTGLKLIAGAVLKLAPLKPTYVELQGLWMPGRV